MRRQGRVIGRDQVERLMREAGVRGQRSDKVQLSVLLLVTHSVHFEL